VICQCLGHHIAPIFRIVEDFLRCSVPKSADECSENAVDLYDATARFHFLYPLLAHDRSKTHNLRRASGMNASYLEHMHLCSFGMFQAFPSSINSSSVKGLGMNMGISLMRGS
jgi:hypothetical protein